MWEILKNRKCMKSIVILHAKITCLEIIQSQKSLQVTSDLVTCDPSESHFHDVYCTLYVQIVHRGSLQEKSYATMNDFIEF